MSNTQLLLIVITVSALFIKGKHLFSAYKEKNKSRLKGELFLLSLILLIGVSLFIFFGK